jgi:membrane-associated phospholipid phosphatase
MNRTFKIWLGSLLVIALSALISVLWFDKPIALLVYDIFGERHLSPDVAVSPVLSIPRASAAIFVVCGLAAVMGRRFSRFETAVLLSDISVLAADAVKNQLKFAFGRTWPDSWGPHILSLIHDKTYGFHFFQSGPSFESFPSGHAAFAAAVMSVLWILYPRLRIAWGAVIVAADVGLVTLNLHFLSDVVVGSFVGVSTGLFTVALWRMSGHQDEGSHWQRRASVT